MLSNAYFLAKFRFDTAENEPAKNLQTSAKRLQIFPIFRSRGHRGWGRVHEGPLEPAEAAKGARDGMRCRP